MANISSERNQPVLLQTAEPIGGAAETSFLRKSETARPGLGVVSFALALSTFWIGITGAYLEGYYGLHGLGVLPMPQMAIYAAITFAPPFLFIAAAWALAKGIAMAQAAQTLADATDRLFSADETVSRTASRLGRAVRREIDALNAGLDGAFARLRALESVLENQIAALDEASARMDVRGGAVASRLTQERERIEGVAASLGDIASRASETVAGRAAQLKATIESAEGALKTAGQSLEIQVTEFRRVAEIAAQAPHTAAIELDAQATRIEAVADAATARAEFVLGRHERHRTQMTELVQRLKDESSGFESTLGHQREALEGAIVQLGSEIRKLDSMTGETDRQLEHIMQNAGARAGQLGQVYAREVERMKEIADTASTTLLRLVDSLHEAGAGAEALIGETTSRAKADAKSLVGEAMGECERLVKTASQFSQEAIQMRANLAQVAEEVERHLLALPGVAQQEAQRVKQLVRHETDEILDLSARTLATIHARTTQRQPQTRTGAQAGAPGSNPSEGDGLIGLARKLTHRTKKKSGDLRENKAVDGKWEMSQLLAAADTAEGSPKELKAGSAAALGALEAALADMAIDLDAISADAHPGEEEWRRYVAGDRTVFARRLAEAIDNDAVNRIAIHYREDAKFRETANAYLSEFEGLLARANEGDAGGLLASTLLSADTGKIYLAIAYALGRL